jgi:uncharacterized protein YuzE
VRYAAAESLAALGDEAAAAALQQAGATTDAEPPQSDLSWSDYEVHSQIIQDANIFGDGPAAQPAPAPTAGAATAPRAHPLPVRVMFAPDSDQAYIALTNITADALIRTVSVEDQHATVNLEFDPNGRLLGIEVSAAQRSLPRELLEAAERF